MSDIIEKAGQLLGTAVSGNTTEVQDLLPKSEQKKRWEMSQKFAAFLMISGVSIVFITMTLNFTLLLVGMLLGLTETHGMNDVAITMTTVFGGIVSAGGFTVYASLQGFRNNSMNKHVTKAEIEAGKGRRE